MYRFKISSHYTIEDRCVFDMTLNHNTVCGVASYKDGVFVATPDDYHMDFVASKFDDGYRFSTGGYFDNRGIFILTEVSLVRCPRYETEML